MFIEGQQIVCVNDEFPAWVHKLYKELPQRDHVYTVRALMLGASNARTTPTPADRTEEIAVLLFELVNPSYGQGKETNEAGFNAERFVPLTELTEEEIMALTKPKEAEELEPAFA